MIRVLDTKVNNNDEIWLKVKLEHNIEILEKVFFSQTDVSNKIDIELTQFLNWQLDQYKKFKNG